MTKPQETQELIHVSESESPDINAMPRADALAIWEGFKGQLEKLKTTAETVTVTDITQVSEMKLARVTRLALKSLRVEIETKRKELGEEALRRKQQIDSAAKDLKGLIEPLETRLLEQEEFIERETARIEQEKREARTTEITPFLFAPIAIDLGKMADADYAALLEGTKQVHTSKLERERKEKEELEAKAKAESEAREAQRLENERLKKEAAEREEASRKEREAAEKERQRLAKQIEDERKAAELKAKTERDAAAAEKAKLEAKLQAERDAAKAKLDAEKAAADEKARKEREAALAPDKEKFIQFSKTVKELHNQAPVLDTEKGRALMIEVSDQIEKFAAWIEKKAKTL